MAAFPQLLVNSIIAGAVYALIGIGFSLIYSCVRFFHFTHAILFTLGAYLALALHKGVGFPIAIAVTSSVACCVLLGAGLYYALYRPLRRRGASPLVLLLASLGCYVLTQNGLSLLFGDDSKSIRRGVIQEGHVLFGARITGLQIATVLISVALTIGLVVFLRSSRRGRAIRAVASDPILAEITGIDSEGITAFCFAVGSGFAAVAGVLSALDVDMSPGMGMNALMMGVVAAIVGGMGSIQGVAAGALLLGVARHFGVWHLGSQWQDAIAFIILLVFLLLRPEGIAGKRIAQPAHR